MTTTANIIQKKKQQYHAAASTSNAVSDAVDALDDIFIPLRVPFAMSADGNAGNGVNDSTTMSFAVATELVGGKYAATTALSNVEGDTVTITVSCNGSAAVAFDSDDITNVAANAVTDFSVTAANAALAAGTTCHVEFTIEDAQNNPLDGIITLQFRRT